MAPNRLSIVWQPYIEGASVYWQEFSLSQIWVGRRARADKMLETVEAGWQVYPAKYGDALPRLFALFSTHAYDNFVYATGLDICRHNRAGSI